MQNVIGTMGFVYVVKTIVRFALVNAYLHQNIGRQLNGVGVTYLRVAHILSGFN